MMHNFRNVVVGSSNARNPSVDEWPKLGDNKPVPPKSRPKLCPSEGRTEPKCSSGVSADGPTMTVSGEVDSQDFPALNKRKVFKSKECASPLSPSLPETGQNHGKSKKKKLKRSTPLQVDICEIIQASALQKKQKCEITALKKSSKIKRKIIGGNLLDADQPKRHKGKVRPWKPRDLTKTKKAFCASRKIHLQKHSFTRDMIKFKESFGHALKRGKVDVDELVKDLNEISLTGSNYCGLTSEKSVTPIANKIAKDLMHNKKFRSYCTNLVTQELKRHASELVITLRKFQDRMHAKDEIKAHAKRRYVCGFNESKKFLLADKVKLLLVATNLEMEEGLPSMIILKRIIDAAEEKCVPVIYAGLGENIGYWSLKKTKISILAVMNFEGAKETYDNLMLSWTYAKEEYAKLVTRIVQLYSKKCLGSSNEEAVKMEVEDEIKETILKKLKE